MARQAKVTFQMPDGERREVVVKPGEEVSVGRHPQCTITISQPSVSRRHARMWLDGNAFFVEDLGSSNGTFVNNQRVQRFQLSDGDEIRCGDFRMQWAEPPSAEAPAPAPPGPRLVGTLRPQRLPDGSAPAARKASGPPAVPTPPSGPAAQPRPIGNLPTAQAQPRVAGALPTPFAAAGSNPRPIPVAAAPQPAARATPVAAPVPGAVRPTMAAGSNALGVDVAAELTRMRQEVDHWKGVAEARAGFENQVVTAAQTAETLRNEIELLKIQLERARIEAATSVSDRGKAETDVTELRQDVQDKARRIGELERAVERGREQAETQAERSVQLTKQIQQQQGQLEEYRREKAAIEVLLAETQEKAGRLQGAVDAGAGREGELVNQVNDLKREVRQKEKAQKDTEKQLEVAEYNLRHCRDENENLRLALGEDDGARKGLNTTVEHLRQVISEKEAMIESLQVDVARWQTRAEQKDGEVQAAVAEQTARARAEFLAEKEGLLRQVQAAGQEVTRFKDRLLLAQRGDGAAAGERDNLQRRVGELLAQVENLQTQLGALRTTHSAEVAGLHAQLHAAQGGGVEQLDALSRQKEALASENARIQGELSRAQAAQAAADPGATGSRGVQEQVNELKRANRDLRNEVEQLQAKLAKAAAAPAPSPATTGSGAPSQELAELRRLFEQANSARRTAEVLKERADTEIRELKEKLASAMAATGGAATPPASAAGGDYQALKTHAIKVYEDINDVASELRNNVVLVRTYVDDARNGVDSQVNLEAAEEILSGLKDAADIFKRSLRGFREVLQRHGYGS